MKLILHWMCRFPVHLYQQKKPKKLECTGNAGCYEYWYRAALSSDCNTCKRLVISVHIMISSSDICCPEGVTIKYTKYTNL